jgi:hypothetical protein
VESPGDPRAAAVGVLRRILRPGARLPGMVFTEEWGAYLFFEEAWLFGPDFAPIAKSMLDGAGGRAIGIAELSEWEKGIPESECLWCFDMETTPEEWAAKLVAPGRTQKWGSKVWSVSGDWGAAMGDFCLAPDTGSWCIYTERRADFAILAIRDQSTAEGLAPAVRDLKAFPLEEVFENEWLYGFVRDERDRSPHTMLPKWRKGLLANYGARRPSL